MLIQSFLLNISTSGILKFAENDPRKILFCDHRGGHHIFFLLLPASPHVCNVGNDGGIECRHHSVDGHIRCCVQLGCAWVLVVASDTTPPSLRNLPTELFVGRRGRSLSYVVLPLVFVSIWRVLLRELCLLRSLWCYSLYLCHYGDIVIFLTKMFL